QPVPWPEGATAAAGVAAAGVGGRRPELGQTAPRYDLLLVGTGFASTFFLREFLRRSGPRARVLVLERGIRFTHAEYLERRGELDRNAAETVTIRPGEKPWGFFLGFGG